MFSFLGIWTKSAFLNFFTSYNTLSRYLLIRSSLASHVPFIWPMTNWESHRTSIDFASTDLANSSPLKRASYSTSLLVAWYCRWILCFNLSLSGDCKTTPIPLACCVDDLSTWTTHFLLSSTPSKLSLLGVNSVMKFARAWAFIAILGWYLTSNSLSSTAHWISYPAASNLFMAFLSGWSVMTLITWAWK